MPDIFFTFQTGQALGTPEQSCNIALPYETVDISHIIDGDTIILKDGRHVRLIGINTPEIARRDRASEQGADVARRHLRELLLDHKRVFLKTDEQHFDRYKRTLAHLFLSNGTNV